LFVVYLNDDAGDALYAVQRVNGMSNNLKVMWKGAVVACSSLTSSHVPGGTEETGGKSVSRYLHGDYLISRTEIRSVYLLNHRTWWIKYPWPYKSRVVLRWQHSGFAKNIRGVFWYCHVFITGIGRRIVRTRGGLYLCF